MKYCNTCQNYVDDSNISCPHCGETYLYIVNPDGTLSHPPAANANYAQQAAYPTQNYNEYQQPAQEPVAAEKPKKKNTKLILIIVAVAVVLLGVILVMPSFSDNNETTTASNETSENTETVSETTTTEEITSEQGNNENVSDAGNSDVSLDAMKVEKIGAIEYNYIDTSSTSAIIYVDENDKYGIVTLDGKNDTGAKYTVCEPVGDYFQVMIADINSIVDDASLNCAGLVDKLGNEIIPFKYAAIDEINERFFRVCEVTERTTDKDEALVYYTDKIFSLTASDDDILFKGVWYIYDVVTGKMLEGISGTNSYAMSAYGDFVTYYTDNQEKITISADGTKISEDATIFENGLYAITNDDYSGSVYNSDGKLFDFSSTDYRPYASEGDYILADKYVNDTRTYVYMNLSGEVVSAEFSSRPFIYGDLVFVDDKIYNFNGENIVEGTFTNVYYEEQFNGLWFLKNDKMFTVIQKDGTVLWTGAEDDVVSVDTYSYFSISKNIDNEKKLYSFADKDFTISGVACAPLLAEADQDDFLYSLVDTVSGKTVLSNYSDYDFIEIPGSALYVYAEKENGGYDVYTIK